jgi:hypothetical protein
MSPAEKREAINEKNAEMQDIVEEQTPLYQAAKKSYSRPATREASNDAAGALRRSRSTSRDEEANGVAGRSTVRTAQLDALFAALKTTTDQICDNLALIQRDDGAAARPGRQIASLSDAVLALLRARHGRCAAHGSAARPTWWATSSCRAASSTSAWWRTPPASSRPTSPPASGGRSRRTHGATTSFSPTATIAAITVQAAIAELDNEVRPVQTILVRELFNGL